VVAAISMIFLRTNWPNFAHKEINLLKVRADLPKHCSISVPAVINNIYWSAVPAQKYLPERRSAAFRHRYIPVSTLTDKYTAELFRIYLKDLLQDI